jgi:hypothetical protein
MPCTFATMPVDALVTTDEHLLYAFRVLTLAPGNQAATPAGQS